MQNTDVYRNSQLEIEQKVIENLLYDLELAQTVTFESKWFTDRAYRQIAETLDKNRNEGVTNVFSLSELLYADHPNTLADLSALLEMSHNAYPVDIERTTKSMLQKLQEQHLLSVVSENAAIVSEYPSKESAALLQNTLDELNNYYLPTNTGNITSALKRLHEDLTADSIPGIYTFKCLDSLLGDGIREEQLIGIAARPGVGKTAFALNIAYKAMTRKENEKVKIDVFSLEMSQKAVIKRFVSIYTGIPGNKLVKPKYQLADKQKEAYVAALKFYKNQQLDVYDELFSFEEIATVIKANAKKYGSNYLPIIDYLQLIEIAGITDEYKRITELTRQLKKLTGKYHIPIICLSQVNRGSEATSSKVPHLSNLRGSGSIEQDFSTVGILHEQENEKGPNQFFWNVEKNREGAIKQLEFKFDKTLMQFDEVY